MRRASAVLALALLLVALAPPPAHAIIPVIDAANLVEQILQYGRMLLDYYRQYQILYENVQQLVQLVHQAELMEQNLENFDNALKSGNPSIFLSYLRSLFDRLQGIVYSADDVLTRYDDVYTPELPLDLPTAESDRLHQTLTTFRTLLAGAQETARGSDGASSSIGQLVGQLDSAGGNLEALKSVGALISEAAAETTRNTEVQAMAVNALTVYYSDQLASREQARLVFEDWIHRGQSVPERSSPVFEPVPPNYP